MNTQRVVDEIDRIDLRLMELMAVLAVDRSATSRQARSALVNAQAALQRARLFVKGEVIA